MAGRAGGPAQHLRSVWRLGAPAGYGSRRDMVQRRLCIGGLVLACAVAVTACGSTHLTGTQNAGTVSGLNSIPPGAVADSIGWIENRSGRTVTLESATVLPLKGFRTPTLVDVAVERVGATFRSDMTGGAVRGWPPPSMSVARLFGYRVRPGRTVFRRTALVVFGVAARRVGRYAVAGVKVMVRDDGAPVTVQAIGPLTLCVSTKRHPVSCPSSFGDRALRQSNAFEGG